MPEPEKHLNREIGVLGLSANIINIIIGAGIFVLPAIVAAKLGSASILAYLFCGILITLMMLCYAEVGSQITETGGAYTYLEKTFGDYVGFIAAILFLIASISATAAVANAIIEVIFNLIPAIESEVFKIGFFVFLYTGLAYINSIGLSKGIGLVKLITLLKLVPLLLLVILGFKDVSFSNLVWESSPSFEQIGSTSLILFFAYTGSASALSVSGEVINPQKTIPRAILLSALSITVIYILIQTVSQGILGDSLAEYTEQPLAEVAARIAGPIGFTLLTIGTAVSMFGGVSSKILSMPRVLFAASKDSVIPIKSLSKIHPKFNTPHVAIIVFAALCFAFSVLGGFRQLAILSSATALLIALGIALAAIKLRRRTDVKTNEKTFRIPGGYTVPILSCIAILWLLSNLSSNKLIGIGIAILVLSLIYFVKRELQKRT